MKNKDKVKVFFQVSGSTVAIVIAEILLVFLFMIGLFFACLFGLGDYMNYRHSIKTKADVFQMLEEHETEYMDLAYNMETMLQESGENMISCNKSEYQDKGYDSSLFKKYPICSVMAKEKDGELIQIDIDFVFPPNPYTYWGIYYSPTDEPLDWNGGRELQEDNGIYTEYGSYYRYETERIKENWYYYQCYTR